MWLVLYNGNSNCSDVQTSRQDDDLWMNAYVGLKVWNLKGIYSVDNAKHILKIAICRFTTCVQGKPMFQSEHGISSTSQPFWEIVTYVIEIF